MPNLSIRVGGRVILVPMVDRRASTVFHWDGSDPPSIELDPDGWWLLASAKPRP